MDLSTSCSKHLVQWCVGETHQLQSGRCLRCVALQASFDHQCWPSSSRDIISCTAIMYYTVRLHFSASCMASEMLNVAHPLWLKFIWRRWCDSLFPRTTILKHLFIRHYDLVCEVLINDVFSLAACVDQYFHGIYLVIGTRLSYSCLACNSILCMHERSVYICTAPQCLWTWQRDRLPCMCPKSISFVELGKHQSHTLQGGSALFHLRKSRPLRPRHEADGHCKIRCSNSFTITCCCFSCSWIISCPNCSTRAAASSSSLTSCV